MIRGLKWELAGGSNQCVDFLFHNKNLMLLSFLYDLTLNVLGEFQLIDWTEQVHLTQVIKYINKNASD